jgi:glycosyltransferase involved in cell wall biosynthesis
MQDNAVFDVLEGLAHFLYRRANLIIPVTQTFAERLVELGISKERIEVVTNGIDPDDIRIERSQREVRETYGIPQDAFSVGYIGTLGMCHGLSTLLEGAQTLLGDDRFHFVVMGDGADRDELIEILERDELNNVTLIDRQPRLEALAVLNSIDASLVMLRSSPVFETVIPSKIFEAMALEKPILLGVRGEAYRIVVEETGSGLAFTPEDSAGMVARMKELRESPELQRRLGQRGQRAVRERYRRTVLAEKLIGFVERNLAR